MMKRRWCLIPGQTGHLQPLTPLITLGADVITIHHHIDQVKDRPPCLKESGLLLWRAASTVY
jgi:hypothetical protein